MRDWDLRPSSLFLRIVCLALAAPLLGCGEGQKPVFPATGKVMFQGKPTPKAVVWLHPENSDGSPGEVRPRGVVNDDGSFSLSTYKTDDGAPAGRYRAVVFWYQNWAKPNGQGDELGKNLLPPRYQDPMKSDLPIVEIKAESNSIPTLELKR
jgi:hypothetical protein